MEEIKIALLSLLLTENIGYITARKILEKLSEPESFFKTGIQNFKSIQNLSETTLQRLFSSEIRKQAEEILKKLQAENIRTITLYDREFPVFFKERKELPYVLFLKGNADLLQKRSVGVVGTRKNTYYGSKVVKNLVQGLVEEDFVVASGLANGIDTEAHSRTLEYGGKTFAVLGHGFDFVYPARNRKLAEEILEKDGALITEFLPHSKPDRQNFPIRNRTLAGICEAIVIVESYTQGGALITAEEARKFNKKVFAVPGDLNNSASEGCHQLIFEEKAKILPSVKTFLHTLNPFASAKSRSLFEDLENKSIPEKYLPIIEVFKENFNAPIHIETLSAATKIPINELLGILLEMECENLAISLPGNLYKLP